MGIVSVQFRYLTGLTRRIFRDARLLGAWDQHGRASQDWSETPMVEMTAEDGCPAFTAVVQFDDSEVGKTFRWSVRLSTASVADVSGMPTEVNDANSAERVRTFQLDAPGGNQQVEEYYFTYARRLGARKVFARGPAGDPDLRFAVWAPNARTVEVVFGDPASGYIADDGHGIDPSRAPLPMSRDGDGIWQTAVLSDFSAFEGLPYMYRLTNAQGRTVYRTDIFSRQQIGRGTRNPDGAHWDGNPSTLDGTKSCSLIVSVDTSRAKCHRPPDSRRFAFPRMISGRTSSPPACPCPVAQKIWSSTSSTSARWRSARTAPGSTTWLSIIRSGILIPTSTNAFRTVTRIFLTNSTSMSTKCRWQMRMPKPQMFIASTVSHLMQ